MGICCYYYLDSFVIFKYVMIKSLKREPEEKGAREMGW